MQVVFIELVPLLSCTPPTFLPSPLPSIAISKALSQWEGVLCLSNCVPVVKLGRQIKARWLRESRDILSSSQDTTDTPGEREGGGNERELKEESQSKTVASTLEVVRPYSVVKNNHTHSLVQVPHKCDPAIAVPAL